MAAKPAGGVGLFLLVLCFAIAGCGRGGEIAGPQATGSVTLDGSPLTQGDLKFFPTGNGSSAQAALNSEGKFRVNTAASATGIAPGEYIVTVEAWSDSEENEGEPLSLIPLKYTKEKSSGLTITVTEEGPNEFHLELKSK